MSRKFRSQKRKKRKFAGNQFTAPEGHSNESLGETSQNKDGGKQLSTETASEEKIVSGKRRLSDLKEDESEEEIYDLEEDCSERRLFYVDIVNEDCVGHVQKRMARMLRDLKNMYKGRKLEDGKTTGGRDRLTDTKTDLFQIYYGKAIQSHKQNRGSEKSNLGYIVPLCFLR